MPESWSPYVPIITGLFRALLSALGGVGFTWALAVNADQIQMVVSALMIVIAAGWSAWQKIDAVRKNKEATVKSATASAQETAVQGTPIAVVVAPKAAL